MNTDPDYHYVPLTDKCEAQYISEGIAKYGYEGFWKMIEELNKQPPKPITLQLIRRKFPII